VYMIDAALCNAKVKVGVTGEEVLILAEVT
jgi:hypothetical protein